MEHPFVEDMQKRVYSIALNGQFYAQLQTKGRSLEKYGFSDLASQILFVFFVLRFLMEKTLQSDPCTLDHIAEYIEITALEIFHHPLKDGEGKILAGLIINGILRNQGEPIVFSPLKDNRAFSQNLNYITSQMSPVRQNEVYYRMSEDGFHLMLSTLEMEENMQLQFRDLIFNLQMKKKNYDGALDEIRNLFHLLKMKEVEISDRTAQIRSNAQSLGGKEYRKMLEETLSLFEEYHEKFSQYLTNTRQEIAEIREHPHTLDLLDDPQDEDIEKAEAERHNLNTLKKIEQLLDRAIPAQMSMLAKLQGFQLEYQHELESQMRMNYTRAYSLKKMIFQPVLENPDLLASMETFLHPLLFQNPDPQFNLGLALEYRSLRKRAEEDLSDEDLEALDEAQMEKEIEEKRKFIESQEELVKDLLDAVLMAPDHSLPLSAWLQDAEFTSANQAREILSALAGLSRVNLDDLRKESEGLIEDELEFFSFGLTLMQVIETHPIAKTMHQLRVEKNGEKTETKFMEDGMEIIVRLDDLDLWFSKEPLRCLHQAQEGDEDNV